MICKGYSYYPNPDRNNVKVVAWGKDHKLLDNKLIPIPEGMTADKVIEILITKIGFNEATDEIIFNW